MDTVAIHTGRNIASVEKFIQLSEFSQEFQKMHSDGNIHGVFYNEDGEIVAEDIWQEIHGNILNTREEIFKNAKRIQGYGQDYHSEEGTPEKYVVEDKEGMIHVFFDNENAHDIYPDSTFEEELQNMEDSGYGEGFKVL